MKPSVHYLHPSHKKGSYLVLHPGRGAVTDVSDALQNNPASNARLETHVMTR